MLGMLFDLAPPGFDAAATPEHARLVAVMAWWLEERPQVASLLIRLSHFLACGFCRLSRTN